MQPIAQIIPGVMSDKAKRYGVLLSARDRLGKESFNRIVYARADDFAQEGKYRTNRRPVNNTKKEWALVDANNASDAQFLSRMGRYRSEHGVIELSPQESDWLLFLRTGEALGDVAGVLGVDENAA